MNAKENLTAYARTFVPALAGTILVGLTSIGIDVDSEALETVLDGVVAGVATLVYYFVVRTSARVTNTPQLEVLNGAMATPTYDQPENLSA